MRLPTQVISKDQGQALADEFGIKFLETSAKSNIGVEEAFYSIARYFLLLFIPNYCYCIHISSQEE